MRLRDPAIAPRPCARCGIMAINIGPIDRIWRVRGSLPIDPAQSPRESFARLETLLQTTGTTSQISGATLTFQKRHPASQDKLAVFDSGCLRIVDGAAGPELHYDLMSRALLCCFGAPALFVIIARLIASVHIAGYVFAGMFVVLYAAGRVIEARLVHALFRARLLPAGDVAGDPARSAR